MTIAELYEKKKSIYNEMRRLQDDNQGDKWTDEIEEQWNRANSEFDEIDERIKSTEAAEERTRRLEHIAQFGEQETHGDGSTVGEMRAERGGRIAGVSTEQLRSMALRAWIRPALASDECRQAAVKLGLDIAPSMITVRAFQPWSTLGEADYQVPDSKGGLTRGIREYCEMRQQATAPGSAGGFIVPDGIMQPIEIALLQFGAPRRYSTIVRTGDGRTVPWPTVNDTSQLGERLAENAPTNQQDVTFGQVTTSPAMYSSKYVPVSIQLMQDSNESMDALLGRLLGERIGRIQSDEFTTLAGDGSVANGPAGLVGGTAGKSAADSGVALGAIDVPTYDNIIDLKHSVDPAYRMMGHGFTFNDLILGGIKKLKDSQGNPIWRPGLAAGEPNTIDGDPYFVNQSMPTGASANAMAYGQLNKYIIHDATDMVFRRLDEIHALNNQVTFLAFMRSTGLLLDAGTNPVKYAANPAT